MSLPKRRQFGIHGAVVCVPANVSQTLTPRIEGQSNIIQVKLKRQLSYKSHYENQYADTEKLKTSVLLLQKINPYYKDIKFDNEWINDFNDNAENFEDNDINGDIENTHAFSADTCL